MTELSSFEHISLSTPEQEPRKRYYIFRGLPCETNSDYIGAYWSTNPSIAYYCMEDKNQGNGTLYVASVDVHEIIKKEQYLTKIFQDDDIENVVTDILTKGPTTQLELAENPDNVRAMTMEEFQALFWDRPFEGLHATWMTDTCDRYRRETDWQSRSQAIFESKL